MANFQLCGTNFQIDGDSGVIAGVSSYFLPSLAAAPISNHWLIEAQIDHCTARNGAGAVRAFRVVDPKLTPAAAVFFLLRLIAESNPELLFLHANTLILGTGAPPIIILGASGAGKSTLTRLLLESSPGSSLLAEDQTILHPGLRIAHPFARAAAERAVPVDASQAWQAFGSEAPRTLRAAENYAHAALPLRDAHVILLGKQPTTELVGVTPHSSVTWWTDALDAEFRAAGLPLLRAERQAAAWLLQWSRPLTPAERRLEFQLLTDGESLLLKSAGAQSLAYGTDRPAAPRLAQIAAAEALLEIAGNLRQPVPPADGTTGGRVLMQLARCFAEAQFHRLEPGGTPAKTVDALLQIVRP